MGTEPHEAVFRRERRGVWLLVSMGLALIAITWAAGHWNLDRTISGYFFGGDKGWYLKHDQPWWFLYRFGTIPGLILSLSALTVCYLGMVKTGFSPYRRHALVVLLTAVIGGGVLVNAVLKTYWGRPRPREIVEFSGEAGFLQPNQRGNPGQGQSFPCGHCTMGFVFIPLFYLYRRHKTIAIAGGTFGLVYGGILGAARIVQGAHFFTDVIWSLGIIAMVAVALNDLLLPRVSSLFWVDGVQHRKKKYALTATMIVLALLMTMLYLTRRPFFEADMYALSIGPDTRAIIIRSDLNIRSKTLRFTPREKGRISIQTQGFGWINAALQLKHQQKQDGQNLVVTLNSMTKGYFSELNQGVTIILPEDVQDRVSVRLETFR
ncbi:MAG: phosphatase PAP2 family protein [Desulfobacteraceae bacterium]|nr:phosphatase PAP2 family protein [Desulfobacteraceae bacterium]